jgi:hypothetical protein
VPSVLGRILEGAREAYIQDLGKEWAEEREGPGWFEY